MNEIISSLFGMSENCFQPYLRSKIYVLMVINLIFETEKNVPFFHAQVEFN